MTKTYTHIASDGRQPLFVNFDYLKKDQNVEKKVMYDARRRCFLLHCLKQSLINELNTEIIHGKSLPDPPHILSDSSFSKVNTRSRSIYVSQSPDILNGSARLSTVEIDT